MSSIAATLCLFSASLCNVQVLDQNLFQNPGNQQAAPAPGGNVINQAVNLFGGLANGGNYGGLFNGGGGGGLNANPNKPSQGQKKRSPHQSPCPQKFQYVTNGQEWKAIIRVRNINPNRDTVIEADFVLPQGMQRQNYQGKIELLNQGESIQDDLANGLPLLFEVAFASQQPVPKLVAIYKNKKDFCVGPPESPNGLRSFRLKFVMPPSELPSNGENGFENPVTFAPQPPPPKPAHSPSTQTNPQQVNQFQDDASVCGLPVAGFTQSLVIGGQAAGRGEWPWLVAFYRSKSGNLEFICGGSLISSTYTLTAAHCIQDKNKETPMQTKNALLFIGKHNLIEWNEEGFEKKGAKNLKMHPDWNPQDTKYDADIALIEMDSPVQYSKFIRPICLWNGPAELTSVVGQNGIVAGWGKNDNGELNTDFPKKVNVPIVSDGQCLRTHEAFVHITSDRTFCAGGRMGEGPCQGDSGGGLMLKVGKKWFLRGIVSASLRDGSSCDVNSYAIFTDLAQFLPWIKSNM